VLAAGDDLHRLTEQDLRFLVTSLRRTNLCERDPRRRS